MTKPTLIDFLEARLDEHEKRITDLRAKTGEDQGLGGPWAPEGPDPVLADIAAKRQLIELHQETEETSGRHGHWEGYGSNERWIRDEPDECPVCHYPGKPDSWFLPEDVPCRTLRILALPHASHPDYRPEWAPDAS